MNLGFMLLPHQTPTSRKPRSRTLTAEQEGIWAASTQSCRTSRGSWWPISRRCCREGRPCLVCPNAQSCECDPPHIMFTFIHVLHCFHFWMHQLLLCPAALDSKASNLSSLSKKYRSDAKYLNTRSTYAKLAAGGVFFIMLIVYVRFWWLWRGKLEAREVSKWRVSWTESEDATKFNPQP